jgi:hypothetical protein
VAEKRTIGHGTLAAAVLLALLGAAAALWHWGGDAGGPATLPQATAWSLQIEPGRALRYGFSLSDATTTMLGKLDEPMRMAADVRLEGELEWIGVRSDAHGAEALMRLTRLSTCRFQLAGGDLVPDPSVVVGQAALVELDARGRVKRLRLRPDQAPMAKRILQLLAGQMQVTPPDRRTLRWRATETTPLGTAVSQYSVRSDDGAELDLGRQRDAYLSIGALQDPTSGDATTVAGEALITVERGGWLVRIAGEESVSVTRAGRTLLTSASRFSLERLAEESGAALATVAGYSDPLGFDEALRTEALDRNMIRQRVGDMTWEKMASDLRRWGVSGTMPDHNAWLWKASGLLIQHPELCAELVTIFQEPGVGEKGRALILDLLVGAGHPVAQAALRAALDTGAAKASPEYYLLFQRLSLLEAPAGETVDYVQRSYGEAKGDMVGASAYAMGAVAQSLRDNGEKDEAERLAAQLERDLRAAKTPDDEAVFVAALGMAALPQHESLLLGFATHPAWQLRLAAATALRDYASDESREAIVGLVADEQMLVQTRAMLALLKENLTPDDLGQLLAAVTARRVEERGYESLVSLVAPYYEKRVPQAEAILRAILAQPLYNDRIKGRVRLLLDEP